jgi:hypothetical protein
MLSLPLLLSLPECFFDVLHLGPAQKEITAPLFRGRSLSPEADTVSA